MNGVSFWNRMELVGLLPINTCNANRDVNSLFRVETIIENRDLLKLFNQNIRQFRNYAEGEKKKNVTAKSPKKERVLSNPLIMKAS